MPGAARLPFCRRPPPVLVLMVSADRTTPSTRPWKASGLLCGDLEVPFSTPSAAEPKAVLFSARGLVVQSVLNSAAALPGFIIGAALTELVSDSPDDQHTDDDGGNDRSHTTGTDANVIMIVITDADVIGAGRSSSSGRWGLKRWRGRGWCGRGRGWRCRRHA